MQDIFKDLGETVEQIETRMESVSEKLKTVMSEMIKEAEKEEVQEIHGYDPNFLKFAAKQTNKRKKKK